MEAVAQEEEAEQERQRERERERQLQWEREVQREREREQEREQERQAKLERKSGRVAAATSMEVEEAVPEAPAPPPPAPHAAPEQQLHAAAEGKPVGVLEGSGGPVAELPPAELVPTDVAMAEANGAAPRGGGEDEWAAQQQREVLLGRPGVREVVAMVAQPHHYQQHGVRAEQPHGPSTPPGGARSPAASPPLAKRPHLAPGPLEPLSPQPPAGGSDGGTGHVSGGDRALGRGGGGGASDGPRNSMSVPLLLGQDSVTSPQHAGGHQDEARQLHALPQQHPSPQPPPHHASANGPGPGPVDDPGQADSAAPEPSSGGVQPTGRSGVPLSPKRSRGGSIMGGIAAGLVAGLQAAASHVAGLASTHGSAHAGPGPYVRAGSFTDGGVPYDTLSSSPVTGQRQLPGSSPGTHPTTQVTGGSSPVRPASGTLGTPTTTPGHGQRLSRSSLTVVGEGPVQHAGAGALRRPGSGRGSFTYGSGSNGHGSGTLQLHAMGLQDGDALASFTSAASGMGSMMGSAVSAQSTGSMADAQGDTASSRLVLPGRNGQLRQGSFTLDSSTAAGGLYGDASGGPTAGPTGASSGRGTGSFTTKGGTPPSAAGTPLSMFMSPASAFASSAGKSFGRTSTSNRRLSAGGVAASGGSGTLGHTSVFSTMDAHAAAAAAGVGASGSSPAGGPHFPPPLQTQATDNDDADSVRMSVMSQRSFYSAMSHIDHSSSSGLTSPNEASEHTRRWSMQRDLHAAAIAAALASTAEHRRAAAAATAAASGALQPQPPPAPGQPPPLTTNGLNVPPAARAAFGSYLDQPPPLASLTTPRGLGKTHRISSGDEVESGEDGDADSGDNDVEPQHHHPGRGRVMHARPSGAGTSQPGRAWSPGATSERSGHGGAGKGGGGFRLGHRRTGSLGDVHMLAAAGVVVLSDEPGFGGRTGGLHGGTLSQSSSMAAGLDEYGGGGGRGFPWTQPWRFFQRRNYGPLIEREPVVHGSANAGGVGGGGVPGAAGRGGGGARGSMHRRVGSSGAVYNAVHDGPDGLASPERVRNGAGQEQEQGRGGGPWEWDQPSPYKDQAYGTGGGGMVRELSFGRTGERRGLLQGEGSNGGGLLGRRQSVLDDCMHCRCCGCAIM